jgi:hypothetical protein
MDIEYRDSDLISRQCRDQGIDPVAVWHPLRRGGKKQGSEQSRHRMGMSL